MLFRNVRASLACISSFRNEDCYALQVKSNSWIELTRKWESSVSKIRDGEEQLCVWISERVHESYTVT